MKKYILYGLAVAVILTTLLLVVSKSNKSKIDEVPEVQNLSVIAQERDESSIDAHATGYEQAVGQQKNNYYIKEVFIDDVKMQHDDYRPFFKGKTIVDSIQWDDNDEVNRRISVYESDSLYIYMSSLDTTHLYSNYIEILSPQHEVKVRDMVFRVGMSVNTIDSIFSDIKIKEEYQEFIGKDKKYFSYPAYFGKSMMIETKNIPNVPIYPCEGLKFQLLEGKAISILVDFRTDGDFI